MIPGTAVFSKESTVQHGAARHSTAEQGTAPHGAALLSYSWAELSCESIFFRFKSQRLTDSDSGSDLNRKDLPGESAPIHNNPKKYRCHAPPLLPSGNSFLLPVNNSSKSDYETTATTLPPSPPSPRPAPRLSPLAGRNPACSVPVL